MMKYFIAAFVLFLPLGNLYAQNKAQVTLPSEISYTGEIQELRRWTDGEGKHLLIASETGVYKTGNDEDWWNNAEIFVYHYLLDEDSKKYELSWKVYDFLKDCPMDLEFYLVDNTLEVTDLDSDDIPEVWMLYKLGCSGDISPLDMKLIMYEGKEKYAMRGEEKMVIALNGEDTMGEEHHMGGKYNLDNAFSNGKKIFRDHAQKIWQAEMDRAYAKFLKEVEEEGY